MTESTSSRARRPRRRGAQLEQAIFDAVVAEVSELGYADVTLDGVARRAGIGRMSLYRRWSGKQDLVLAALRSTLPAVPDPDPALSLRDDLVRVLSAMFEPGQLPAFAVHLAVAQAATPEDARLTERIRQEILRPRLAQLERCFTLAAQRGELRVGANIGLLVRTGPAVLFQHAIVTGAPPTPADIIEVVDGVLLPAAAMRSR